MHNVGDAELSQVWPGPGLAQRQHRDKAAEYSRAQDSMSFVEDLPGPQEPISRAASGHMSYQ